jgi:hypothetical protein
LPTPATAGGGKTPTNASGTSARTRAFSFAIIEGMLVSAASRSEKLLKGRKTAAVFD